MSRSIDLSWGSLSNHGFRTMPNPSGSPRRLRGKTGMDARNHGIAPGIAAPELAHPHPVDLASLDAAPPPIRIALVPHKAAPVTDTQVKTWPELAAVLTTHRPGQKDGPAWMPADIEPGPRRAERVKAIRALSLDIESRCEGAGQDKRVAGPLPPELPELAAMAQFPDQEGGAHA